MYVFSINIYIYRNIFIYTPDHSTQFLSPHKVVGGFEASTRLRKKILKFIISTMTTKPKENKSAPHTGNQRVFIGQLCKFLFQKREGCHQLIVTSRCQQKIR